MMYLTRFTAGVALWNPIPLTFRSNEFDGSWMIQHQNAVWCAIRSEFPHFSPDFPHFCCLRHTMESCGQLWCSFWPVWCWRTEWQSCQGVVFRVLVILVDGIGWFLAMDIYDIHDIHDIHGCRWILDIGYWIYDIWYMIYGIWYMVYDIFWDNGNMISQ